MVHLHPSGPRQGTLGRPGRVAAGLAAGALSRDLFPAGLPLAPEVYALYDRLAAQSGQAARADAPLYLGKTAFALLLGREIGSSTRWLAPGGPPPIAPTVARLLFVFQNRLRDRGVVGLEEWVADARLEAEARGLDLRGKMTSWYRMDARRPKRGVRPRTRKARAAAASGASGAPADPADPADPAG